MARGLSINIKCFLEKDPCDFGTGKQHLQFLPLAVAVTAKLSIFTGRSVIIF